MADISSQRSFFVPVTDKMREKFDVSLNRNREQLHAFASLLLSLNKHHNLISRRSEDNVFVHHVLHSLALVSKRFHKGTIIVDWGSGGGLPAIPLAIAVKDVHIVAVDAVEKKTRAVRALSMRMGIEKFDVWNGRAEAWSGRCDYSVSRATAPLSTLWSWHQRVAERNVGPERPDTWTPGLLCLKGGDLDEEIGSLMRKSDDVIIELFDLAPLFEDPYFQEKVLIHVYEKHVVG